MYPFLTLHVLSVSNHIFTDQLALYYVGDLVNIMLVVFVFNF